MPSYLLLELINRLKNGISAIFQQQKINNQKWIKVFLNTGYKVIFNNNVLNFSIII
jgi:hypothetical protein